MKGNPRNSQRYLTGIWQRNAPLLRLLLLGFLMLLLQIPIMMIDGQINERQQTSHEASREIMKQWGSEQRIAGPRIVVPYTHRWVEPGNGPENDRARSETRYVSLLPGKLVINGDLHVENRYRGIYQVPVYLASIQLTGRFSKPDISRLGIDPDALQWQRAQLVVQVSDTKAIRNSATLHWGEQTLPFKPGSGHMMTVRTPSGVRDLSAYTGIHAELDGKFDEESYRFSIDLDVNGSRSIRFLPMGDDTKVNMNSDWQDPSFQGEWLPDHREVGDEGFQAQWHVPNLGRSFSNAWILDSTIERLVNDSAFGVDLITPIDRYRMVERSTKYQILFLLLTFLTLWLFEVLTGTQTHPIQYLLVGASLCLFYLLELSLAEHIGFISAYLIAASLVVGQITCYSLFILKHPKRTAVVSVVLILLYGYLYVLLQEQDFALLFGTLGLFAALGVVMFATRNVDWNRLSATRKMSDEQPELEI